MAIIRNTPILSSLFGVLLIGLLSSCGGGGSSSGDSTAVSAVIGSAGGSLTSSDGNATLTVPAGALADDTKITMTEVSGNDIPAELQDPSVLKVYDMQPDGLQFATPATVEVHTLGSTAPPDGAPLIGLISDSHSTLELLGPVNQTIDSNGITVSGPINHFSSLAVVHSTGLNVTLEASPSTVSVGGEFTVTATVIQSKDSQTDGTGVFNSSWTSPVGPAADFDPPGFTIAPAVNEGRETSSMAIGTCAGVGTGKVNVVLQALSLAKVFQIVAQKDIKLIGNPTDDIVVHASASVECINLTPAQPTVGTGLHNAPGGLTKLEQLILLGSSFANLSGDMLAAFAGAEGYVVSDLATGEVKRTKTGAAPFLGAVPISQAPPGPDREAEIFLFGSSPFIDYYYPNTGDFGGFVLTFPNAITDVSNAGGALTADEQLYVDTFGVSFVAFDSTAGSYQPTSEMIPASGIGGGTQVSAFEQTAGGPVLVVTRVAAPGAGRLFFAPRDSTAPTDVGAVGPDARRIRCAASVCAVTSFAGDELTIALWDGANLPTIIGNVTVGDGPVDLDLVVLTNGDVRIGSTGFNDNTWTLTEIASDGSVVSNTTLPVDAGCTNPGHLSFFEDSDGMKALVTCYGSDNYDVLSL